jgi:hypothetical protein
MAAPARKGKKMPKFKCTKCGAKYYGWATKDTCDCGGKLKEVKK